MNDTRSSAVGYNFSSLHSALARYVDSDILPGVSAVVLVGQDLVDLHCVGWADREAKVPLRADHLFRVFSNTKLITSCAALLLFDEGLFRLDDPIEKYIPELANRRVLRTISSALDDTEPARGSITIRHLLSHSAGLIGGNYAAGSSLRKAYVERKVMGPSLTLAQMMGELANLPLAFHPGTAWEYSIATDVIARLVEILSGQRFDEFITARILRPLGMDNTGYVVPEQNRHLMTAYYAGADDTDQMKPGLTRIDNEPYPGAYLHPVPKVGGTSGLVSTLPDMVALLRSLIPGGKQLLKPTTLALMMANQLPDGIYLQSPAAGTLKGHSFGLSGGLILETLPLDHAAARGELYWGGAAGTQWWISPKSNVAGILMTQRRNSFLHPFVSESKKLIYQAVSDRRR